MQHLPELLAPAGDKCALLAALANGADAVYFGVDKFNARRNASNFCLDTLSETCDLVHLAGARAYLTLNTIILPEELDEAIELARQAWYRGVDALIVQDLGLLGTLHELLPQLELHTSTQMNIHNSEGIKLAARLGARRVTLARELKIEEVGKLVAVAANLGVELEVFAHGALCICYSGQCLMSSVVGTRSANRGLCAQPCRLPYKLIDTSTGKTVNTEGDFPLSPADLNTIDLLDELVNTGVASLKVEGRMKDSAYVATVTGAYRTALDQSANQTDSDDTNCTDNHARNHAANKTSNLANIFNRGYTQGYLTYGRDNSLMSHKRPDNRAYAAGLDETWSEDALFSANRGLVGVSAQVRAHIGEPLQITFETASGVKASATGAVVEVARTKALSERDLVEHIGRVGGSPFTIESWQVSLDDGVGLGFSALHKLRNTALEQLRELILAPWHERKLTKSVSQPDIELHDPTRPQVVCLVSNEAVAKAARKAGANTIWHTDAEFLPQIMHDYEAAGVLGRVAGEQAFVVNNIGQISAFAPPANNWVAGAALNITNSTTVATLAKLGAFCAWLSPELTLEQIQQLGSTGTLPLALTVYGQQQLMITEHCVLMSQGPCNQDCRNCARRKAPRLLEDRKGYRLPVWTDCSGRSHIHNAVTLDLIPSIPDLLVAGVTTFVVDASLLSTKEAAEQIERTRRALKVAQLNGASLKKQDDSTTGHLYRAVD